MLLSRLQSRLAGLYAAPIPYDVYDFLITDRDTAAALTPPGAATGNRERLLVRDADEDLELSLFIDAELLAALDEDDPTVSLHDGNLGDFLVAVEGVSFDAGLPPDAQSRYVAANRLAARYCHTLRRRYPGHHHQHSFVRELRDFYRMSEGRKVRHIMALD